MIYSVLANAAVNTGIRVAFVDFLSALHSSEPYKQNLIKRGTNVELELYSIGKINDCTNWISSKRTKKWSAINLLSRSFSTVTVRANNAKWWSQQLWNQARPTIRHAVHPALLQAKRAAKFRIYALQVMHHWWETFSISGKKAQGRIALPASTNGLHQYTKTFFFLLMQPRKSHWSAK